MVPTIIAQDLVKQYHDINAVDGISFSIKHGEIFGFLGPNGAGKTTTVRMLTGVISPTSGSISVLGLEMPRYANEVRKNIGVLPETANVYVDLTGQQNMDLFGDLYGLKRDIVKERSVQLLKKMNIYEARSRVAKKYSKGMRQRLSLAMALMTDGEVLFLDEPTSGLDAESSREIRGVISDMAKEGRTIVLTTHNMQEAQDICSRVAVINRGKIAVIDTPMNLRRTFERRQSVVMTLSNTISQEKIMNIAGISEVLITGPTVRCYTTDPGSVLTGLVGLAKDQGLRVISACTESASLEDVFLDLIKLGGTIV
ncbi:MAG: ATP-binding cassette domain-containing protein [Candidatus Thorarchaeota archaeon]|nr:ATP-binding cassette domain-containing protein [Candidatus Thorarchaeota archaeon]